KWAGRSDNIVVKVLSIPGLYLQKITTKEPDEGQLEVAIAAINAVCDDTPAREYILSADGTEESVEPDAGDAPDAGAPEITEDIQEEMDINENENPT
ncbi:MAG: DUF1385 domain-containing protein, partial [Oscillospiraceae bacterium]|nr:DUF1385 domain-containing protein [Oscillospiraceae bacterium]